MPVEKRPAVGIRGGPGETARPPIHLCIPDLSAEEGAPESKGPNGRRGRIAIHDPIAAARSRLSEKRFRDGHQQVTTMIEDLRERRRRQFRRFWLASMVLTAGSAVVLAFGLLRGNGGDAGAKSQPGKGSRRAGRHETTQPQAIDAQANLRSERDPIQPVAYEAPASDDAGVWLEGTIAEGESDESSDGVSHDHH